MFTALHLQCKDDHQYYYDTEGINADIRDGVHLDAIKEKYGIEVVFGGTKHLQLDIDSEKAFKRFFRVWKDLKTPAYPYGIIKDWKCVKSKTPGHYHITCELFYELSFFERVAYNIFLGSDPLREAVCVQRYLDGEASNRCHRFFKYAK